LCFFISSRRSPDWYWSVTMSHPPTNSPFTYSCGIVGHSLGNQQTSQAPKGSREKNRSIERER
jgi:hypothetical protein